MTVITGFVSVQTKGFNDIIDITANVEDFIKSKECREGQILVFINGATAAISTTEYEPGLLQDIPKALEKIAPLNGSYKHNDTWHDGNGYAHVRSTLMGPMAVFPVYESRIIRGTWQNIILLDFDTRTRQRQVTLQFSGETNQ